MQQTIDGGKGSGAESPADYAAYLLEHECGLVKDAALQASISGLRKAIGDIEAEKLLSTTELHFLITRGIDIMPPPDIAVAAEAHGFSRDSCERIQKAYVMMIEKMREVRGG